MHASIMIMTIISMMTMYVLTLLRPLVNAHKIVVPIPTSVTKLHRVVAIAFVIVIVVAIYIVVVLFPVRPHVRRSSPSACSVHPPVGQASPFLRPVRPFVWSKGATRKSAAL